MESKLVSYWMMVGSLVALLFRQLFVDLPLHFVLNVSQWHFGASLDRSPILILLLFVGTFVEYSLKWSHLATNSTFVKASHYLCPLNHDLRQFQCFPGLGNIPIGSFRLFSFAAPSLFSPCQASFTGALCRLFSLCICYK